jgi:hypothetical protein
MKPIVLTLMIAAMLLNSCCKKITPKTEKEKDKMNKSNKPFPPTLVYKTKLDYFYNVPVTLNDEKTMITSYPDVKDVFYKGELAYPTKLENGYLLDNRGISKNIAFLKYTYEEYSKLEKTPDLEVLFKSIIDNDPLLELYKCDCQKDIFEINNIILSNTLKNCYKLKIN